MIRRAAVDEIIASLEPLLDKGDHYRRRNSNYRDTLRRYGKLKEKGLNFVDIGTPADFRRLTRRLHDGGRNRDIRVIEPLVSDACVKDGYLHTGKSAAGISSR